MNKSEKRNLKLVVVLFVAAALIYYFGSQGYLGQVKFEAAAAPTCTPAIPAYATYQCKTTGTTLETVSFNTRTNVGNEIVFSHTCQNYCEIKSEKIFTPTCSGGALDQLTMVVASPSGSNTYTIGGAANQGKYLSTGYFPGFTMTKGQIATVKFSCSGLAGSYLPSGGSAQLLSQPIAIYQSIAGRLDSQPVSGTDGCTNNVLLNKIGINNKQPSSYYDTTANKIESLPTSGAATIQETPTNWEVGYAFNYVDHYIAVPTISPILSYADNQYHYCDISDPYGQKKLLTMSDVQGYCIPTNVERTVECCYDGDCAFKGAGYFCDSRTWTCSNQKPCNADLECGTAGQCINRVIKEYDCDMTRPIGGKSGTCTSTDRTVTECPSDCTGDEAYDYVQGKCIPKVTLNDCGSGFCCLAGSIYKPQSCDIGLKCCPLANSLYKGECKSTCDTITTCQFDSDCNDMDQCTEDKCSIQLTGNKCVYKAIPNCYNGTMDWTLLAAAGILVGGILGSVALATRNKKRK